MAFFAVASIQFPATYAQEPGSQRTLLTWVAFEQAPYFIRTGALKNKGVGDYLLAKYQAAMPMFDHTVVFANTSRYARALKSPNICVPMAWSRAEEEHLLHSRAHTIEPPMGLLMHKENNIPSAGENPLSLKKIMGETNLRIIALKPFQYPTAILDILDKYETTGRVMYLTDHTIEINERLLERKRADIAIAIPSKMTELNMRNMGAAFQFRAIEELNTYLTLMSHCSNDPAGQTASDIIGQMLTDEFLEELLTRYLTWYTDVPKFEASYRSTILETSPKPKPQ